ncbi:unnamed protein product [Diabrotica balteata]|uniref:Uncharacterized protein n=1 Tax=Diabrotica balteata TaxID=107213 RepID=A0A9N9TCU0_DIABA|nr:unnamed protein product [Diabrotica balteata]
MSYFVKRTDKIMGLLHEVNKGSTAKSIIDYTSVDQNVIIIKNNNNLIDEQNTSNTTSEGNRDNGIIHLEGTDDGGFDLTLPNVDEELVLTPHQEKSQPELALNGDHVVQHDASFTLQNTDSQNLMDDEVNHSGWFNNMQSSSSSRISRIMALAKKINSERYAPDQVRNSEISERHLLEEENAALVSYDNANCVIVTDNDNNKPGASLLRVDLPPKRKDDLKISDFVSDNDDDSIKDPNYESDSSSSSSSSSSTSSNSSSSSSSDSPGGNCFLSNSNNVSQVADIPLADSQAVNTPTESIQVPDVEVADTLAVNLQSSGPET